MNEELLNQELINEDLYKKIFYELENLTLEKKTPANIREELSKRMSTLSSNRACATATIAAFYYYSLGKKELSFLQSYYRQTFSTYFNKRVISQYFNEIISNEFILNTILDICNDDIIGELFGLCKRKNEISKEDNLYSNLINKVKSHLIKSYTKDIKNTTLVSIQNEKSKNRTTKIRTFEKNKFQNLARRIGLRKLVSNLTNNSFIKEESSYDKIATTNKEIINLIIKNSKDSRGLFVSVSDLEKNMIDGIKKSLQEIYVSYKKFKVSNLPLEMIDPKNNN